jgi:hypothetical protein
MIAVSAENLLQVLLGSMALAAGPQREGIRARHFENCEASFRENGWVICDCKSEWLILLILNNLGAGGNLYTNHDFT